jgi:hypothetical protein
LIRSIEGGGGLKIEAEGQTMLLFSKHKPTLPGYLRYQGIRRDKYSLQPRFLGVTSPRQLTIMPVLLDKAN